MSKCQRNKYLAGGRCVGGGSGSSVKEGSGNLGSSFSALLAAREAQTAILWTNDSGPSGEQRKPSTKPIETKGQGTIPLTQPTQPAQQQLVVQQKTVGPTSKLADIALILGGDLE